MARNPQAAFIEEDDEHAIVENHEETVVTSAEVNARVKGTWTMYYAGKTYDFRDGVRYKLPRDLYEYLKKNQNIYDTLA